MHNATLTKDHAAAAYAAHLSAIYVLFGISSAAEDSRENAPNRQRQSIRNPANSFKTKDRDTF